ncbi:unnamed protein product [Zymoseptoria tritici ST99CH_3D1]|nr:unnamed protein product [Zymoseptoria tritici ST99CH_3D1]
MATDNDIQSTLDVLLLIACALGVAVLLVRNKQSLAFSKCPTPTNAVHDHRRGNARAAFVRRQKNNGKTWAMHNLTLHEATIKHKFLAIIRSFYANHGPELVFLVVWLHSTPTRSPSLSQGLSTSSIASSPPRRVC